MLNYTVSIGDSKAGMAVIMMILFLLALSSIGEHEATKKMFLRKLIVAKPPQKSEAASQGYDYGLDIEGCRQKDIEFRGNNIQSKFTKKR